MYGATFRPRILNVGNEADLASEIALIGANQAEAAGMLTKARCYTLKLHAVNANLAHILKKTFLSAGGDAAISAEPMPHGADTSDVILIGTRKHFSAAAHALMDEGFGAPTLAAEIEAAIAVYEAGPILPAPEEVRNPKCQLMYREMERRTIIMGILNVTPDSFSDGGQFYDTETAIRHAEQMIEDGADIIDIGGESTRPGSKAVSAEEEIARVVPIIKELAQRIDRPISIDTYKSTTAAVALDAGADIINDISAMAFDPDMKIVAAERGCPVIMMHIKGTPRDMQVNPAYNDLMGEIMGYLRDQIGAAIEAGVDERLIILDPGIGFGKTVDHNLKILRRLEEFKSLGRPILVGVSRKATIGHILGGLPPEERVEGTAAAVALSIANHANIIRVHDVKQMARVAKMADAILRDGC